MKQITGKLNIEDLRRAVETIPEMGIIADILRRHLDLDINWDHVNLGACPRANLEPWEKAHVICAMCSEVLRTPCVALMLLAGCSHEEAHEAISRAEAISHGLGAPGSVC